MSPPAAADTIRTLIAAVPDDRLREIFLELALAALAVPAVEEPRPAARNGRPAPGPRQGRPARQGQAQDRPTPPCLARRAQRQASGEATQPRSNGEADGGTPKRRGRKSEGERRRAHGNGARTVSAAALWEHARNWSRSSPGAPSRANSASATGLLNSLTVTWPCPRTSARPPRPAFSHCKDGIVC